MAKKQARISEKVIDLAKKELKIDLSETVTVDELMTLLIMKSQTSVTSAQSILDYAGDEFTMRVDNRPNNRLRLEKGHFVENGNVLKISELLYDIDHRVSDVSLSDLHDEIASLREENNKAHRIQSNVSNTHFLGLKLMIVSILRAIFKGKTPESMVADITLAEKENNILISGVHDFAIQDLKQASKKEQLKKRGRYND